MKYDVISADCHIDLIWLPPDLFTANALAAMKDRMPYVTEGPRGKEWVTKSGASFGLMNGMGSAGRLYERGKIHRSDRMASEGIYDDGKKGIRRMTDSNLRIKDQERDGIQAEVLYGILGATSRLNDDEAAGEMLSIYNEWLAGFCNTHPDRFAGLACIPNHDIDAAVGEIERVARRGGVRGLEISRRGDMTPLWDPWWNPMWDAVAASGLPVHFHTIGSGAARLHAARTKGGARRPHRRHHQLPDVYVGGIAVGDLLGRARTPPRHQARHRRGRYWLDPLHPAAHGRRVGRPVQGARSEDEAQQILAAPVLCHLSERPDRRETHRRARRGQNHVGLGLPAPRRGVARFAGIHPARARPPARSHPPQDRLRQRRQTLPVRGLIAPNCGSNILRIR